MTSSGLDWVEICAPGISKAYAVERICARLGIGVSEVMAIGDNHNDLTVPPCGLVVTALANAIAEVLAAAQTVLPSNGEDGVAQLHPNNLRSAMASVAEDNGASIYVKTSQSRRSVA